MKGMLLLLRECQGRDYFSNSTNFMKNVDAVVTYKKRCSNTIKFGLHNIPRPLKQVSIQMLAYYTRFSDWSELMINNELFAKNIRLL